MFYAPTACQALERLSIVPRLIAAVLLALGLLACGTRGSGTVATEERTIPGFFRCRVDVPVAFRIFVNPLESGDATVTLEGDDNLLSLIRTDVIDGTLTVTSADGAILKPVQPLSLDVDVAELMELEAEGSAFVSVAGLGSPHIFVSVREQSRVSLEGTTDWLDVVADGRSSLSAITLIASSVTLDARGGARLEVCATESLSAEVSGSAGVSYACNPAQVASSLVDDGWLEPY